MNDQSRPLVSVAGLCNVTAVPAGWRRQLNRLLRSRIGILLGRRVRLASLLKPGLLIGLTLAFLSGTISQHEPDLVEIELPLALEDGMHVTWEEEQEAFAKELRRAFVLPLVDARSYADWIIEASDRQGLDRYVLASLISAESDFISNARSRVGAFGPAQIRRELWQGFCYGANLNDPADNISCAAQILTYFTDRCGSLECALKSYNVGYKNHSHANAYYVAAGNRYVDKVKRNLTKLNRSIDL